MDRTIRVTGKGQMKVAPDTLLLHLEVEETGSSYLAVMDAGAKVREELGELISRNGFDCSCLKVKCTSIDFVLEPTDDAPVSGWRNVTTKYRNNQGMILAVPNEREKITRLLYDLEHYRLRVHYDAEYTVSDPEKVHDQILACAVAAARAKAEVLAAAAGVSLEEVVSMDYSWSDLKLEFQPMLNQTILAESNGIGFDPDDPDACADIFSDFPSPVEPATDSDDCEDDFSDFHSPMQSATDPDDCEDAFGDFHRPARPATERYMNIEPSEVTASETVTVVWRIS